MVNLSNLIEFAFIFISLVLSNAHIHTHTRKTQILSVYIAISSFISGTISFLLKHSWIPRAHSLLLNISFVVAFQLDNDDDDDIENQEWFVCFQMLTNWPLCALLLSYSPSHYIYHHHHPFFVAGHKANLIMAENGYEYDVPRRVWKWGRYIYI